MFQITEFSLAIVRGTRALFVSLAETGEWIILATRQVVDITADEIFTSRGNVTNAAVRDGSALLTGSTMSVATLDLRAATFYEGPAAAIRFSSVGDNTPEDRKEKLVAATLAYYHLDGCSWQCQNPNE